jgi:hypothetical protein
MVEQERPLQLQTGEDAPRVSVSYAWEDETYKT